MEDLKTRVSNMERDAKGPYSVRKGIVRGPRGYLNLQYLPGTYGSRGCAAGGGMLCIIGRDLNRQELCTLFDGE